MTTEHKFVAKWASAGTSRRCSFRGGAPARARAGKARRPPFRPCLVNARCRLGRGHLYACSCLWMSPETMVTQWALRSPPCGFREFYRSPQRRLGAHDLAPSLNRARSTKRAKSDGGVGSPGRTAGLLIQITSRQSVSRHLGGGCSIVGTSQRPWCGTATYSKNSADGSGSPAITHVAQTSVW